MNESDLSGCTFKLNIICSCSKAQCWETVKQPGNYKAKNMPGKGQFSTLLFSSQTKQDPSMHMQESQGQIAGVGEECGGRGVSVSPSTSCSTGCIWREGREHGAMAEACIEINMQRIMQNWATLHAKVCAHCKRKMDETPEDTAKANQAKHFEPNWLLLIWFCHLRYLLQLLDLCMW